MERKLEILSTRETTNFFLVAVDTNTRTKIVLFGMEGEMGVIEQWKLCKN